MMEDVSATQNHSVQLGPPSGGIGINSKQSQDDHNQRPHYSIPGILHFIQHEWARFEMERAQWEVERAELQVSVFTSTVYLFRLSTPRFDRIKTYMTLPCYI